MIPVVSRGARLVTQHPHLMANYGRLAINIVRGEGCWLYDESGNAYLDMVAGIAVCALGHAHPRITRAIAEQAATLGARLEPGPPRAGRHAGRPAGGAVAASTRSSSATAAPRPTRRRSSWPARPPTARGEPQRNVDPGRERLVPRPHARRAGRHRQPEIPGGLRAAAGRVRPRAVQRRRRAGRGDRRAHGLLPGRAGAGRERHHAGRRRSTSRRRGGCATSAARC